MPTRNQIFFITGISWLFLTGVHAILLNTVLGAPPSVAIADSLVYNLLFSLLSFGIVPMALFDDRHHHKIYGVFIHLIAAGLLIGAWLWISDALLRLMDLNLPETRGMDIIRVLQGYGYYLIVLLLTVLFRLRLSLIKKIENENRLLVLARENELKALRSQVNPHFLFNSLNSISSLTVPNPAAAREMIIKLSEVLRYSVSQKEQKNTLFGDDLYYIRQYVEIEKIRFGSRLNYQEEIGEDAEKASIPVMLIQPLIENSIKHGVYHCTEPTTVKLSASTEDGYLLVQIANSYNSDVDRQQGTGTGLKNVRERLSLVYNRVDLTEISDNGSMFIVYLRIPQ